MALIHVPVELPAPGREIQPLPGLRVWRNALNGFVVIRTHYTADPARRGDWRLRESAKYGGLRSWRWRKEQEIDPDAAAGRLVFEQYNPDVHVILPFTPPDHWPRWLLFDPGWTNPAALTWVAVDVDTPPNMYGYQPIHVYREFQGSKRSGQTCAIIAYEWSKLPEDKTGAALLEPIEEIIVDPAAKQEHQSAAAPDHSNESAATVLEQFEEKIRDLGWDVPVDTGNNAKDHAIEELIARFGCYWLDASGVPLYDADDNFREPTEKEIAEGAEWVRPTIYIHEPCRALQRELAGYRWRDWASKEVAERHNLPEKPIDRNDHSITNLIRFVNHLRELRDEDGKDLTGFTSRFERKHWKPPEEVEQERFRTRAGRYRRRLARLAARRHAAP